MSNVTVQGKRDSDRTTVEEIRVTDSGYPIVQASSGSQWSYGTWPSNYYLTGSASTTTQTDNAVVYTSGDVSSYNIHVIENTSATDPVDVYISIDGTNFLASASAVRLHDATTSGTYVVTIPAGDVGILDGNGSGIKVKKIKVLKDGATAENPSIRYAHGVI